jgi:hypothetical protein
MTCFKLGSCCKLIRQINRESEIDANAILQPVIALGLWSGVMMIWMYVTCTPVIAGADIPEDEMGQPVGMSYLPSHVRRIADNYNHLFEQPTFSTPPVLLSR